MFRVVIRDLGPVDDRVELRVHLERLDHGEREEGQEAQLDAFPGLEVALGPVPQPGDSRHVGLNHRGELGRDSQRLHHPLGDDLAGTGQPLGPAAQARRGRWRLSGGLGSGW